MSNHTECLVDDFVLLELNLSPPKHNRRSVTRALDLSDEVLLFICHYLPPACILDLFYTPSRPELRLHRVIFDYYTKIKLDGITVNEYDYLSSLFRYSQPPFRPASLILSNEHVTCLIQHYFVHTPLNITQSIFISLKSLTLIDCSQENLVLIDTYNLNLSRLEYLHITVGKLDENISPCDLSINKLLFANQLYSLHTACIQLDGGLILSKSLISHKILRNVNLVLRTIDDLYVLLDGLVPNVQTMIIQLCRSRLLTCLRPQSTPSCPRLIEFTFLESGIELVIDDIKCMLGYMPALIKLTLSIRDTSDLTFCCGSTFESMLIEHLPHLLQFDYTMTHRIVDKTLIEDFGRWPMEVVFYEDENCKWIHIFSLPWPSNKDDKRQLPIVNGGLNRSVTSLVKRAEYMEHVMITKASEFHELKTHFRRACQITTCLSIDIELPERISKIILTKETPISSITSIVQPYVRHLIVERRLNDENEIFNLTRQFPYIEYLKLLFPLEKSLYIRCLKHVFNRDNENECYMWPYLVNFSTDSRYNQFEFIYNDNKMYEWLIQNTDLKYFPYPFYVRFSLSKISVWL